MSDASAKEREILKVMRQVLTGIVREVTPQHKDLRHPLSQQTIQDIRHCLGLITARERELADAAGRTLQERPRFADQPQKSRAVPLSSLGRPGSADKDEDQD